MKPGGGRKTYADYFYADEVNAMVDNLKVISKNLGYVYHSLEDMTMYEDNGRTMTYDELNRIEQELSSIYNQVLNRTEGRRKLQFNFGDKEDF